MRWKMNILVVLTPPKTNISPENAGWKTIFLSRNGPFSGDIRSFLGGVVLQKSPQLFHELKRIPQAQGTAVVVAGSWFQTGNN